MTLFLVATPIGNLADITYRAVSTLQSCDYILCEDTRHSQILLHHYQISRPLKSYHKFNEASRLDEILSDLRSGKKIGLISDAGTPAIADPGLILVQQCIEHKIPVVGIPGPCALIHALTCSGFETDQFQFCGFLPKKEAELRTTLQNTLSYPGTTICYESPQRLIDTLNLLNELDSGRILSIARELTKKFEEVCRGTAIQLIKTWENRQVKGEIILLISGKIEKNDWTDFSPLEHVEFLEQTYNISRLDAIKLAAELRGVPKRTIYNTLHSKNS